MCWHSCELGVKKNFLREVLAKNQFHVIQSYMPNNELEFFSSNEFTTII